MGDWKDQRNDVEGNPIKTKSLLNIPKNKITKIMPKMMIRKGRKSRKVTTFTVEHDGFEILENGAKHWPTIGKF